MDQQVKQARPQGSEPAGSGQRPARNVAGGVRPQASVPPANAQMRRPVAPSARVPQSAARPVGTAAAHPNARPLGGSNAPVRTAQAPSNGAVRPLQNGSMPPVQEAEKRTDVPAQEADNPYVPNFAADFGLSATFITTKGIALMCGGALLIGLMFGAMMFGKSAKPQVQQMRGVVRNYDITQPLPRCGQIDKGRACILYIMNSTRYDKTVEEFFDDAVALTEIQKYAISMVNPKYAKERVPPGYFAEIKIPNL